MGQYVLQSATANLLVDADSIETVHALSLLMSISPSVVWEDDQPVGFFVEGLPAPDDVVHDAHAFEERVGVDRFLDYVGEHREAIAAAARSARLPGRSDDYVWVMAARRMADVVLTSVCENVMVPR